MRIQFLVVATLLLGASILEAQNWPGRSVRLFNGGVEVLDSARGNPRRIFGDSTMLWLLDPSVAPGGRLVGVVKMVQGRVENGSYVENPQATTYVLNALTGDTVLAVRRGYAFAWCGSSCLTVIYGEYNEGSEMGPTGDSAAVLELPSGRRRFVFHDGPFYAPLWIPGDSSVVFGGFYEGPKFMLDSGRRVELASFHAKVSASGRWSLERDEEALEVRVVDSADTRIRIPIGGRWQVEEWLGRTDKVLLLQLAPLRPQPPRGTPRPRPLVTPSLPRDPNAPPAERTYRIWDVPSGQVSEEWKAAETSWRGPAPNGCRLFLKDGRLTAAPGCR